MDEDYTIETIASRRAKGTLRRSEAVDYGTADVLRKRAEKAKEGSVENEEQPWEAQALRLIIDRLQAQDDLLMSLGNVIIETHVVLKRIEDALGERSEPSVTNIVFDMKNVAEEVSEAFYKACKRVHQVDHRLGPS